MADRDSSANNSRYSRSTEGIPQFGSFGPLPAGQRTTVSSNPQRVTEDTLTQYMDEQSKNYDRSQREIEALTASSSSRAQNTSSVPNSGAEGGPSNETRPLTSFDISVGYHHAYSRDPGNVAGSTDLTTTGGGPSIDPPWYDQQKKE
ncbi:hypothetical protein I203_103017 [Kwoniella mangroviensis CBS 8507]|uniref:uncharacterized protein n=1 Tax=Kwoniella mangroviensis CBS 8507 TaxID=1296122 RepID=UPI00080D4429|nr:uncharacterized protein I203_03994 [Kwoniella mangroviensis CBS 8507]OCF67304.1 hypothetical protein I203_03994 [Kwoniella mangroviensis CBS 8507]